MKYSPSNNLFYPPHILPLLPGRAPDDLVKVTDDEFRTYGLGAPPAGKVRGPVNGRPAWIDAKEPETIEQAASRQRSVIENALVEALAYGMAYTMPDGISDVVQMQAKDRQNLMGLAIEARDLVAAGETGAVQEFRAQSNTRYPMTPSQIIDMTDQAMAHYKQLLEHSWDRKDAIAAALADDTLTDEAKREAIEAITW